MDKSGVSKNNSTKWQECMNIDINSDDFPDWFYECLLDASNAISVSHEAIYHMLVSTVNYSMLHSDVVIDGMDWREPVLLWNLIVASSGSRKTLIHKTCSQLMDEAVAILERRDQICIKQWEFKDGSVERIGTCMKENFGKLSILQDEAGRFINISSSGSSSKVSKEATMEMLLLEAYNAAKLVHQTVSATNYCIDRSGLIAGGFTQPDIGLSLLKDGVRSATGFAQRFAFHFVPSKYLPLGELTCVDLNFKSAIVEDVLYPLLRASFIRGEGVLNYILLLGSEAYTRFELFHDEFTLVEKRLSSTMRTSHDVICSYIGKMNGKVLREAAILTELLPRLKKSLLARGTFNNTSAHTDSRFTKSDKNYDNVNELVPEETDKFRDEFNFDEEESDTFSHETYNTVIY